MYCHCEMISHRYGQFSEYFKQEKNNKKENMITYKDGIGKQLRCIWAIQDTDHPERFSDWC